MNNKTRVHVSKAQSGELVDVPNNKGIINWTSILEVCGDENMIKEIVKIFLEDSPKCIEFIANAIKTKNPEDVKLYAHRLKGAARHVATKQLSEKAYRLECAGKENDMEVFASLFEDVKSELENVMSFLSRDDWIETAKEQSCNKQQIELS